MEKKYSLTNESKTVDGHTVYRIIAEKDFDDIKKGTLGGFVESEDNLSHKDRCWIYDNAEILGKAKVYDNAKIYDFVRIFDNAKVYDNAIISGNSVVCDNAIVYHNAMVCNNAQVYDNAKVHGRTIICDNARVYGNAHVYDYAMIYDNAKVYDNAQIYSHAEIFGNAKVYGNGSVSEYMSIKFADVNCSLINNILENIRCQTGLIVVNNKIFAYKQIKKDMTSFYDKNFKYEVGKIIEVKDAEISNASCARGLHFSNANCWNNEVGADTGYLMAEIDIKDIITVQQGKIRCKKAKILGTYNI